MFGSILKYTAVAVAGAVAFTTVGFFMDADVIEAARKEVEDKAAEVKGLEEGDTKEVIAHFVAVNRDRWIANLTFARSVEDLDAALAHWL